MKDYSKMSDFEINKAVAECLGLELSSDHSGSYVGIVRRSIGSRPNYIHVNYCNNPSDAWPIILVNGISVCSPEHCITPNEWAAGRYESFDLYAKRLHHGSKNPLRAAMIVYLMIKDVE